LDARGGTAMRIDITDNSHVIKNKYFDTFWFGFNEYLYLRESCYGCKYKGVDRIADFSLADFWGVDPKRVPREQLKYGISLIMATTDKARDMMSEVANRMHLEEISEEGAIKGNPALVKDKGSINPNRDEFFYLLNSGKGYDWIITKRIYSKIYLKMKVKILLNKIFKVKKFKYLVE